MEVLKDRDLRSEDDKDLKFKDLSFVGVKDLRSEDEDSDKDSKSKDLLFIEILKDRDLRSEDMNIDKDLKSKDLLVGSLKSSWMIIKIQSPRTCYL